MAINEIAKTAAEGLSSSAGMENKPGKFEVPGKQNAMDNVVAGPERCDAQKIKDNYADISNEAENTKPLEPAEGYSESLAKQEQSSTEHEFNQIKKETDWSGKIIDNIQNMEQYEILKNAGLKEVEINGRKCLIKENIDLDYADADGMTNHVRIEHGLAPLGSNGKPIELHHLGQKNDSPLVELTEAEHRTGDYKDGKKNQSLWHDKETEVDRSTWNKERQTHWEARSEQLLGGNN